VATILHAYTLGWGALRIYDKHQIQNKIRVRKRGENTFQLAITSTSLSLAYYIIDYIDLDATKEKKDTKIQAITKGGRMLTSWQKGVP
jgi:hypothetical protein